MKIRRKLALFLFISIIIINSSISYARLIIVLFDNSGSFIGPNAPITIKINALKKLNEIVQIIDYKDTLIFIPIRGNSTESSLRQIRLIKEKASTIYDPIYRKKNLYRMKVFAQSVLKEINKPYSKKTDILSAINYAASISRLSHNSSIWCFSDGDDNVQAGLYNQLNGIKIYHLFIYSSKKNKTKYLIDRWKNIYRKMGAISAVILDAQSSINYNINFLKWK